MSTVDFRLTIGTVYFRALHDALTEYVENGEDCDPHPFPDRLQAARAMMERMDAATASLATNRERWKAAEAVKRSKP